MKKYPIELQGKKLKIGIVRSRFSDGIGARLEASCLAQLAQLGVKKKNIALLTVPGALEIPLALQNLASCAEYDALIALGVVIRGETYHFELVANESAAGIARVALDFNIPVANAVLTTENESQALARTAEKGRDAANVAVEGALLLRALAAGAYLDD